MIFNLSFENVRACNFVGCKLATGWHESNLTEISHVSRTYVISNQAFLLPCVMSRTDDYASHRRVTPQKDNARHIRTRPLLDTDTL